MIAIVGEKGTPNGVHGGKVGYKTGEKKQVRDHQLRIRMGSSKWELEGETRGVNQEGWATGIGRTRGEKNAKRIKQGEARPLPFFGKGSSSSRYKHSRGGEKNDERKGLGKEQCKQKGGGCEAHGKKHTEGGVLDFCFDQEEDIPVLGLERGGQKVATITREGKG